MFQWFARKKQPPAAVPQAPPAAEAPPPAARPGVFERLQAWRDAREEAAGPMHVTCDQQPEPDLKASARLISRRDLEAPDAATAEGIRGKGQGAREEVEPHASRLTPHAMFATVDPAGVVSAREGPSLTLPVRGAPAGVVPAEELRALAAAPAADSDDDWDEPADAHISSLRLASIGAYEYDEQEEDAAPPPSARAAVPLARDSIHEGDCFRLEATASGHLHAVPAPIDAAPMTAAEEALAAVEHGLASITDNLRRISESMNAQQGHSEEVLDRLANLPAALDAAGESTQRLDGIRRALEKQNFAANELALSMKALPMIFDAVQDLPRHARDQLAVLDGIDTRLSQQLDTGQRLVEQFEAMTGVMRAVGEALEDQKRQIATFEGHQAAQLDRFQQAQERTVAAQERAAAAFAAQQQGVVATFQEALTTTGRQWTAHVDAAQSRQAETLDTLRAQQSRQLKAFHEAQQQATSRVVTNQKTTLRRMEDERKANDRRALRFAIAAGLMFLMTLSALLTFGIKNAQDEDAALAQQSQMRHELERLAEALAREKELQNREQARRLAAEDAG